MSVSTQVHSGPGARRSIRRTGLAFLAALALALPSGLPAQSGSSAASEVDSLTLIPLVPPDPADVAGVWNYTTGQPTVAGRCPAGMAMSGQIAISFASGTDAAPDNIGKGPIRLDILSGSTCKPEAVCHLRGMIAGTAVVAGAFAVADDEGGQAAVAWTLYFVSSQNGAGTAIAHYAHPQGLDCDWAMDLTLTRADKDQ